MSDSVFQNDPAMQEYFKTLPLSVQEGIKQSGANLENIQQLKDLAAQLTEHKA